MTPGHVMTERVHQFASGRCRFDVNDGGPIDGEVVVLLHGFPQTAKSWEPVCGLLQERGYRTLTFDQRGYAPRARPRGRLAYRMSALVGDVVALIAATGPAGVHLVGHDWGAAVAWSTAARFPALVSTLTTVSVPHPRAFVRSMLSSDQAARSYYMALFQFPWLPEFVFRRYPDVIERIFSASGMTAEQVRQVQNDIVHSGALTGGLNWYRGMPFSRPAYIGKVAVPTTYVWSTGDDALGRRGAELCERYVTGSYRLQILDGTHWIPEEHPDLLSDIILARIAGQESLG
jgi:pimeloyl-ACP methyl ester carboxylesterase